MTVAEVIQAARGLTSEERAQIADALYAIDEVDETEIDGAWASLVARRAEDLESGAVRGLTRKEADEYLDALTTTRRV